MKTNIETLFKSWVYDNQNYIDDIYEYFVTDLENNDNSLYDWGTEEEVEEDKIKLKEEILLFLEKYRGVTAKEYLYGK
jgi:uncharacterized protein YdcH (DUF465 family)